ncbi:hypothetical protein QWZ13_11040 [Reinekea marina]|nr:hypothetical protein [Reinekea marina]MDN3649448.1 hypothetical protein [Reinekea marina]
MLLNTERVVRFPLLSSYSYVVVSSGSVDGSLYHSLLINCP